MTQEPNFCPSCGEALESAPSYCPKCGANLQKLSVPHPSKTQGVLKRYWGKSIKGRVFYGAWVFLNVSNGINLMVSSSAPKDRLRNVCNWEGVQCAPSAQEQALQSLFNLILWNAFFWLFRYFYKKRQIKNSQND